MIVRLKYRSFNSTLGNSPIVGINVGIGVGINVR
jgi:hypothetical protein